MSEPFRTRSFVAVEPHRRPVRQRAAVRVIVTDGSSVLLLSDTDPGAPGTRWWVTPGGGIDPGEQPVHAAANWPKKPDGSSTRSISAGRCCAAW